MTKDLGSRAGVTRCDIVLHDFPHLGPPKVSGYQLHSLVVTKSVPPMESRVETATLGVGMDLQGHKVVPGNITAHLGTGILDQHHAIWKPVNWK